MIREAAVLAAGLLLSACLTGRGPTPTEPVRGYLDVATVEAIARGFVAPPPAPTTWPGDVRPEQGPGSDRWWLATAHAELRPPGAAQHFDCVLGTRLAATPRPALTRLMTRLLVDSDALTRRMADLHPRRRPIAVDRDLQPCQRLDAGARDTPSWPAGGAVVAAAYGEMFAALAPDRAEEARRQGQAIGWSRAVCRMNWREDVDAGGRAGRQVYVEATRSSDFAADLEAARAEVVAARAEGLTNPACAAERRALGRTSL